MRRRAEDAALTFDETTEFVRQLAQRPAEERERRPPAVPERPAAPPSGSPSHDTPAGVPTEAEWSELVADADASDDDAAPETSLAGGGVAGALRMLRSQGILEETSAEQREREKTQLRYDAWMHAQKKADQQRGAGWAAPHDQRQREKREAEAAMERFKDYTPDVKLEYHDEFGRTLTQKEAWKRLSHVFHGNAPGHKAQEKRLRRIAEEQRRERMLAGDTSTLSQAFQARSERTGQAHMVLSVGHHDHAPQEIDLLGKDREADLAKAPAPPKGKAAAAKKARKGDAPPGARRALRGVDARAPAPAAPTDAAPEPPRERIRIALGKRKAP
ncbi:hypothetical protein CBS14141_003763 [Malassezia furfur]|nr:hypothetical protein CBS14141_003763 [Malassezia furfur]